MKTMTLPKGRLLYRGFDMVPGEISTPTALNSEGVLWLAHDSLVAQTYIPDAGGRVLLCPPSELSGPLRPDDGGPVEMLVRHLGGGFEILSREWPLSLYPGYPDHQPDCAVCNGTYGRPWCWRQLGPHLEWPDLIKAVRTLGYRIDPRRGVWLKTSHVDGVCRVLPARHRFRGCLGIYQTKDDLVGSDYTQPGSEHLLDPDYHKAAAWTQDAITREHSFVQIDDFAQTLRHGNVGHHSIALNRLGIYKVRLVALIPAVHREWRYVYDDSISTIEERAWRRDLIRSQHDRDFETAAA